jgi:putative transposase
MPRRRRASTAGLIFHIMNRAAKRSQLFDVAADYAAFERIMIEATRRFDVALFAYCLMPNHWHFVASPRADGALSRFMHWLTTTHARRWSLTRGLLGEGAVYQGRFKAIPVKADFHFLTVCRYVERNALRASLTQRAEEWRWSSLWQRTHSDSSWLAIWPCQPPPDWLDHVNAPQTLEELARLRAAVSRAEPFGDIEWVTATMARLGRGGPA